MDKKARKLVDPEVHARIVMKDASIQHVLALAAEASCRGTLKVVKTRPAGKVRVERKLRVVV